jgi:hypothetical protein
MHRSEKLFIHNMTLKYNLTIWTQTFAKNVNVNEIYSGSNARFIYKHNENLQVN